MKLYTTIEAARELGLRAAWVRRLCVRGLAGRRIGGIWLLTEDDLAKLRDRPRVGNPTWKRKSKD